MNNENDSRRVELEARRYHIKLRKTYGEGVEHSGEFFYDSLRAARAFVRTEFKEWCDSFGLVDVISASEWKDVWGHNGLSVDMKDENGVAAAFVLSFLDTAHPEETERRMYIDIDCTEAFQRECEAAGVEQEEA